jgi:hypothetical protein
MERKYTLKKNDIKKELTEGFVRTTILKKGFVHYMEPMKGSQLQRILNLFKAS